MTQVSLAEAQSNNTPCRPDPPAAQDSGTRHTTGKDTRVNCAFAVLQKQEPLPFPYAVAAKI